MIPNQPRKSCSLVNNTIVFVAGVSEHRHNMHMYNQLRIDSNAVGCGLSLSRLALLLYSEPKWLVPAISNHTANITVWCAQSYCQIDANPYVHVVCRRDVNVVGFSLVIVVI